MSLIAASIYTAENPLSEAQEGYVYHYGFSYAFSWIVFALGLIGGGMTFIFQNEISNTSVSLIKMITVDFLTTSISRI